MKKNRQDTKSDRQTTRDSAAWLMRVVVVAFLISGIVFAGKSYINNYYKAEDLAIEAMQGNELVNVTEEDAYYCFAPAEDAADVQTDTGIIFYPGAKVEERAYAPLLVELAESGYTVYLMRMPARLAVLKPNAAELVMDMPDQTGRTRWILMGHSLGGAMAASYAAGHSSQVSGLVLLAAYSTKDLQDCDIPVLCLYGSEDGVLDLERYQKYKDNLPEDAMECVIDGGNHAGYAFYGEQKGDFQAQISADEQQQTVVDEVNCWVSGLGW